LTETRTKYSIYKKFRSEPLYSAQLANSCSIKQSHTANDKDQEYRSNSL